MAGAQHPQLFAHLLGQRPLVLHDLRALHRPRQRLQGSLASHVSVLVRSSGGKLPRHRVEGTPDLAGSLTLPLTLTLPFPLTTDPTSNPGPTRRSTASRASSRPSAPRSTRSSRRSMATPTTRTSATWPARHGRARSRRVFLIVATNPRSHVV